VLSPEDAAIRGDWGTEVLNAGGTAIEVGRSVAEISFLIEAGTSVAVLLGLMLNSDFNRLTKNAAQGLSKLLNWAGYPFVYALAKVTNAVQSTAVYQLGKRASKRVSRLFAAVSKRVSRIIELATANKIRISLLAFTGGAVAVGGTVAAAGVFGWAPVLAGLATAGLLAGLSQVKGIKKFISEAFVAAGIGPAVVFLGDTQDGLEKHSIRKAVQLCRFQYAVVWCCRLDRCRRSNGT
jgi:hypothetical protein